MLVKNDSKTIAAINNEFAKAVSIKPLSEQHRADFHGIKIKTKGCFQNAYSIVSRYPEKYAYVLGVNNSYGFAFEHAFVKDLDSGEYIDPTLDAIGKIDCENGIFSLVEFDSVALSDIIFKQGDRAFPPDFEVMATLKLNPEIFIDYNQYQSIEKIENKEFNL